MSIKFIGKKKGKERREKGERRKEKGEGRREKGEGRREKGEGKGEGKGWKCIIQFQPFQKF